MSLTSKPAAEVAAERKVAIEQHAQILAALAEFGLSTSDPVGAIRLLATQRDELARALEGVGPVIDYPEITTWCGRDAARVTRGHESWSFVRALRNGVALALYSRTRDDGVTERWDGMASRAVSNPCAQPETVPRGVAIAALDALGWPVHPPVEVATPVVAATLADEAES